MKDDHYWMGYALKLAVQAKNNGEVPVGAVIVNSNNDICATGKNNVISDNDITSHAEIIAIRKACKNISNYRLLDMTLYVTLEPCPMCAGAIVASRIKRLVFASRDFKAGATGSVYNLLQGYSHKVLCDEGVLQHECAAVLQRFFAELR